MTLLILHQILPVNVYKAFCWDLLMTFIYLYLFIAIPYILAFHRVAKSSDPESLNSIYPAYVVCIFDIVLNYITGFTSSDGHEIFLDPILIIRHYTKGYFLIDFVSSVPYVWFYRYCISQPGPDSNSIFLIPECLPLLKLLRIYTLRLYTKQIITSFEISHAAEITVWMVLLMLLMLHWCSCLSHIFPIVIAHIHGDTMEKCILIVMILQLVESAAEPELKYQRIMHQVKEYIHDKKLPQYLKDKLIAYYEYRFQGSYFKERAISCTLSVLAVWQKNHGAPCIIPYIYTYIDHLNQEIMIHSSRGLLDTVTILHYLPRNVIGNLMGILKPVIYLNEDVIYKSETEGDCMFFIISGTIALITFQGKEICHEKDGGYFGEGALIFPERRRVETAIALETCELLRLYRRDFKRMFSTTSTFYKRLEKVAKERHEQMINLNANRNKSHPINDKSIVETPDETEYNHEKGDAEILSNKSNI
ncbi:potassium/sodium hyperpolarization-activated cyclic nucleotide-gated channel 1-like [Colletes gigas]|uniref:potassium/sodium hyperpolarization-activated cyclic nucleotide-gated channel 1-like n=1 Tax=Colletes gigas TaxID=935657 RepID=UPI001C9B1ACA|nr:potassium/sodium hyperpolarization-activated cyclic nucleotide-gated channel 1-like [Colletes gigas]